MYYHSKSKKQWVRVQDMNIQHLRNALRKDLTLEQTILFDELTRREVSAAGKLLEAAASMGITAVSK